jgi:hypothetical protein
MQHRIASQADEIRYLNSEIDKLERENMMLSEQNAEMKATMFCGGIVRPDGTYRDDAKTVLRVVSIVMEKLEALS